MGSNKGDRMMRFFSFFLLFGVLFLFFTGCEGQNTFSNFFQKELFVKDSGGDVLAIFSDVSANKNNFVYYEDDDQGVIDSSFLETLSVEQQEFYLKKFLLQRHFIADGLKKDIFSDEKARRYLLPRMAELLENYYFLEVLDYDTILGNSKKIYFGENSLNSFYEEHKSDFSANGLDKESFFAVVNSKITEMALADFYKKRLDYIEEILDSGEFDFLPQKKN